MLSNDNGRDFDLPTARQAHDTRKIGQTASPAWCGAAMAYALVQDASVTRSWLALSCCNSKSEREIEIEEGC